MRSDMEIAAQILEKAAASGRRIAAAESCTGGLVAARLTETPGSSAMFERGFVTYTNAAKIDLLGVTQSALERYGAVSEAVAAEMAQIMGLDAGRISVKASSSFPELPAFRADPAQYRLKFERPASCTVFVRP